MLSIKREYIPRWRGTTSDLAGIAGFALQLLKERVGLEPPLQVVVKAERDEDHFSSVSVFEEQIKSLELRHVTEIKIVAGSISTTGAVVSATFSKQAVPAVSIEVEGSDRILNEGLCQAVTRQIKKGQQLSIPTYVLFFVYGLVGFAVGYLFSLVNWFSVLPDNWIGTLIYGALYIILLGSLIFGLNAAYIWAFPVLELLPSGGSPRLTVWRGRIIALAILVGTAVITGLVSLALDRMFGNSP